jgi:hypothetical protein
VWACDSLVGYSVLVKVVTMCVEMTGTVKCGVGACRLVKRVCEVFECVWN